MEASLSYLKELFALGNTDIKTYSPLTLAYIAMPCMRLLFVRFW